MATDENVAEKLRRDNIDQFNTLVRMHLSFVLDLNHQHNADSNGAPSEKFKLKKWNLVSSAKKPKNKGVMDGAPLTQEGICQAYQLIEFLRKEQNICVEGVFRRTGSLNRQQELRSLLNRGVTLNLEGGTYSVHDCASVLKTFLAELPEPLLTEAHYPAYCQIAELCGISDKTTKESRLLTALQLILLLLPQENKLLLKDLLDLLHLTASHEPQNKMSADSLATLFTPHLLCSRKLSPENLHTDSQILAGIVSFMITHCANLFEVPKKLAVDIKAYYSERMRRNVLSPAASAHINESVSDNLAANTVFSFVDHELTAKENQSNPTETALAQLYAYIQGLPESAKKRKLVKQFNKENGHGTPLQVLRSGGGRHKTLGDSIKKHLLVRGLVRSAKKSAGLARLRANSEELLNSPTSTKYTPPRSRLFCTNCNSSDTDDVSNTTGKQQEETKKPPKPRTNRSFSEPDLSKNTTDSEEEEENDVFVNCLTSTPACVNLHALPEVLFTPEERGRRSMSPITRSTQRMCKAMQEAMMTPRSRKPVLLISGTNITKLPASSEETKTEEETPTPPLKKPKNLQDKTENDSSTSLSSPFQEYLCGRSMLTMTASPTDNNFSSCTDDYDSNDFHGDDGGKLSSSLLFCLDGNVPEDGDEKDEEEEEEEQQEKELVLKPKQYDENGKLVFETSF